MEKAGEELQTLYEQLVEKHDALRKKRRMLSRECKELKDLTEAFKKESNFLSGQVERQKDAVSAEVKDRIAVTIKDGRAECAAASKLFPTVGGFVFRLFVGNMDVRLAPDTDQLGFSVSRFKNSYVDFKYNFSIFISIFSLVLLFVPSNRGLDLLHTLSLVYFYVTLTLRESVLQPNGSNIKPWWTMHHYLSNCLTITMMTWPPTLAYSAFRKQFLVYAVCQGFVGLLQVGYQKARIYKEVSLGKSDPMTLPEDITGVGNQQSKGAISLIFLVPCVLSLHFFQAFNSYTLWSFISDITEWQVYVLSILFGIVSVGNILTTLLTLLEKYKRTGSKPSSASRAPRQRDKEGSSPEESPTNSRSSTPKGSQRMGTSQKTPESSARSRHVSFSSTNR